MWQKIIFRTRDMFFCGELKTICMIIGCTIIAIPQ